LGAEIREPYLPTGWRAAEIFRPSGLDVRNDLCVTVPGELQPIPFSASAARVYPVRHQSGHLIGLTGNKTPVLSRLSHHFRLHFVASPRQVSPELSPLC